MTLPYEHEVRVYAGQYESVIARCTCGGWEQDFDDSMALLTVGEAADSHLATHPEPPRLCVGAGVTDHCALVARFTITGGPEGDPFTESCPACLGNLVAGLAVTDQHRMVMVTEHPAYDGHTPGRQP